MNGGLHASLNSPCCNEQDWSSVRTLRLGTPGRPTRVCQRPRMGRPVRPREVSRKLFNRCYSNRTSPTQLRITVSSVVSVAGEVWAIWGMSETYITPILSPSLTLWTRRCVEKFVSKVVAIFCNETTRRPDRRIFRNFIR